MSQQLQIYISVICCLLHQIYFALRYPMRWHLRGSGVQSPDFISRYEFHSSNVAFAIYYLQKSIRAERKFLFFVLATFYLEISAFITRNFDFLSRNFEL